ncbi:MAG: penicillin-binding protein 2 [Candidatus Omnitrophota bacterium]
MRVRIISWFTAAVFLALSLAILNLQLIRGSRFKELSDKNCIRLLSQNGSRGRILDRRGEAIVSNYISYDLMLLPRGDGLVDRGIPAIAGILDSEPKKIQKLLDGEHASSSVPVAVARDIGLKKAIALEEKKLDMDNIIIQPNPLRSYPYGGLACHLIGHLNEIDRWRLTKLSDYGYKIKDVVGYSGVEERYDYYLRQEEGGLSVEVDNRGKFVRVLGFRPGRDGKDIQLTLDLRIQKIIEECLGDEEGCIIIMDPANGEVIAMASRPKFNPEAFVKKRNSEISRLFKDRRSPFLNRAISGCYPAASIFKLVVASAALEKDKINLGSTFICNGSTRVGRKEFKCWDIHNQQDILEAITHSCDVFFYRTGLLIGPDAISEYALKFGFSKATGIDLPYEEGGLVPNPFWKKAHRFKNWFDGDTANFSIGQGDLLVTPLQVTRMMAIFANGGSLVTPYTIMAVNNQDISGTRRKITNLGLKPKTIETIRRGLRKVVAEPSGTANNLCGLPVTVAGKTGTAQVSRGQPHGWFAGFFPYERPRFVICVFLENGGSGHRAAAVARQVIEGMAQGDLLR